MVRLSAHRARWWQLIPVVAVAAVSGSAVTTAAHGTPVASRQASGAQPAAIASRAAAAPGTGAVDPDLQPYLDPQQLKAVPVGPAHVSESVKKVLTSPVVTTALDASGIPAVALEAYQRAAAALAVSDAACHLPWQLLAGIGRVESDNGQFGGAVLLPDGYGSRPIYGLPLDGRAGVALVRDTDGGKLDGDPNFDRAVGPMQFIPSTWALYGADGDGDGKADPNNIFDAALGAADYLCAGGGNLASPAQETAAVLRYNDADQYVRVVLALAASYQRGDFAMLPATAPVSSAAGPTPATPGTPSSPPAETQAPQPTALSSPTTAVVPTVTATPTESPSAGPATASPATPAPTDMTQTGPALSGRPVRHPVPYGTPRLRPGQTADIGWAPAMRQVVVGLLGAPHHR